MKPENYRLPLYKAINLGSVKLIFWLLLISSNASAQNREQTREFSFDNNV